MNLKNDPKNEYKTEATPYTLKETSTANPSFLKGTVTQTKSSLVNPMNSQTSSILQKDMSEEDFAPSMDK